MAKSLPIQISQADLKDIVSYDPETGHFTYIGGGARRTKGTRIGHRNLGYEVADIAGRRYRLHRIAWLYMTGQQPPESIDHANGDKADNRWANLRAADPSQQQANAPRRQGSAAGLKGVTLSAKRRRSRWRAIINVRGRAICLGFFGTKEEAHAAYRVAAVRAFGEFARFE